MFQVNEKERLKIIFVEPDMEGAEDVTEVTGMFGETIAYFPCYGLAVKFAEFMNVSEKLAVGDLLASVETTKHHSPPPLFYEDTDIVDVEVSQDGKTWELYMVTTYRTWRNDTMRIWDKHYAQARMVPHKYEGELFPEED